MISSETPYKLADIIRDTWPQLYRPPNNHESSKKKAVGEFQETKKTNL